MPFTPSHVAAAVPLLRPFTRAGFTTTGLVIGCMVPDLPYYLPPPLRVNSGFTHTALGVVSVDLALGLVCVAVWHALIGPLALAVAPAGLRARAARPRPARELAGRRALLGVALGLVTGAFTHIWWDAFTHQNRYGAHHLTWLAEMHGPLAGYRWAQYGSGVFGALVVLGWAIAWWRRTDPRPDPAPGVGIRTRASVWGTLLGALALGALAGLLRGHEGGGGLRHTVFLVAIYSGGAAAAAALLSSIALSPVLRRAAAS